MCVLGGGGVRHSIMEEGGGGTQTLDNRVGSCFTLPGSTNEGSKRMFTILLPINVCHFVHFLRISMCIYCMPCVLLV